MTAVQRYLTLADRGYQDDAVYEELVALFAADAVVDIDGTPVRGTAEIRALYRRFFDEGSESSHHWHTEILADGTHKTVWVEELDAWPTAASRRWRASSTPRWTPTA